MKNSSNLYKYVVVLGLDGMGNFNRHAKTPCMDLIFKNGAVTYDTLSMNPTISAENWGAMLLGASPVVHGLTNSIVGRYEYDNDDLPSVFARIRAAMPDAYLASCCNWNLINHGIIEHNIGVDFFTGDNDPEILSFIFPVVAKKPTFLFVQFDEIDGAGHAHGYGTAEYLSKITEIDALVGKVYDAYKCAGILDETLFLVIADHGGVGNGHGGYMDSEKYVFFGACGKNVPHGEIGNSCTKDIAATVLYALGLDIPEFSPNLFSSQIPAGIFPGVGADYYITDATPAANVEHKRTPDFNSEQGLCSFLSKERIKLALFFDDSLADASGQHTATEHGTVKYYSNGIRGSYGEFGKTGHAVFDSVKVGSGSFSVAAWIKKDSSISDAPALCGNKDWWQHRREKGFIFALRCADTVFNLGTGDEDFNFITPLPDGNSDGWLHTVIAVDKESKEIRCYYNFRPAHTARLEDNFLCDLDALPFTLGDDGLGNYNCKTNNFLVYMDDFLLLDGAISDAEIESLSHYYSN